jgi:hypothetical protein
LREGTSGHGGYDVNVNVLGCRSERLSDLGNPRLS